MNKKQKAITILQRQRNKLEKLKNPTDIDVDWVIQTKTYIDKFFGENSPQSKRLIGVPIAQETTPNFIPFLKDCIETINDIGLYKKPKTNFLYTIPEWAASLLLTLIFIIGVTVGETKLVSSIFKHKDKEQTSELFRINSPVPSASITKYLTKYKCE